MPRNFPTPQPSPKGFAHPNSIRNVSQPSRSKLLRIDIKPAFARGVIRDIGGLVKFFLETRGGQNPGIALTGDTSAALLRVYLLSVAERGRTAPGAAKTSLRTWSETLGAPRPLDNPLVCADAQVESNEVPKHAPPAKLDTVKKLEQMALNVEISPIKRAFDSGILLVTYASMRFSGVQRLRSLEVNEDSAHGAPLQSETKRLRGPPWPLNEDSAHGAPLQSKTKRLHGPPRPCACPRMGISGPTEWIAPIVDFHNANEKQNGSMPSFVPPD